MCDKLTSDPLFAETMALLGGIGGFVSSFVLRALVVCTIALGLSGCGDRFPDYRYKMTIYVDGKAFSSVRAIEQEEISSIQSSSGRTVKRTLTGEAVIIEANGRTYYALLTRPDNADYATLITGAALATFIPADMPERDIAGRSRAMTEVKGAHPLPRTLPPRQGRPPFQAWPMFVTFDDPKDPKTVREVSPESIGVINIAIEITDEDVTTGIKKRLGWLANQRGSLVRRKMNQTIGDMPAANRLNSLAFEQRL